MAFNLVFLLGLKAFLSKLLKTVHLLICQLKRAYLAYHPAGKSSQWVKDAQTNHSLGFTHEGFEPIL